MRVKMQENKTRRLMRAGLMVLMIFMLTSMIFLSCERGSKALKYVHTEPGFSFEYPAGYKEEPTLTPVEIKRFAEQNEYKVPIFTATVREKSEGVTLMDLPDRIIKSMETTIPGSSGFSILKTENLKLSDGSGAVHFQFEWTWVDGTTVMESAFTGAFKGDKIIMISGTTIKGLGYSLEDISKYCKTLRLTP